MTAPQKVEYIRTALETNNATHKVVPDQASVLKQEIRKEVNAVVTSMARSMIDKLVTSFDVTDGLGADIALKLSQRMTADTIREALEKSRTMPWQHPIKQRSSLAVNGDRQLQELLRERIKAHVVTALESM